MREPLLVVLEGANDLAFLTELTQQLRRVQPELPDLRQFQAGGHLVLIPVGGGHAAYWPDRFRPLGLCEFHLYDREQQPETFHRAQAIAQLNARPGCFAALTRKRSLENYLHPQAIMEAGGERIEFGDEDSVSCLLARQRYELAPGKPTWDNLSRRAQRRLSGQAKRWL